ncbi:uncharacterized protein [Palaemon carinicauda]|uniref:uncharacterized protein n=1 Tax=Palaemon carinicauda TaxID=392227 RepID=UPI0035B6937C
MIVHLYYAIKVYLAKAMDIIDTLKDKIAMLRSREEDFKSIWQRTADLANNSGITVPDVGHNDLIISRRSRRQTRAPERLHDSILLEPLAQHCGGNTKDEFRTDIFYVILDTVASKLGDRFTSSIMQGVQALNPASEGFLNLEKIKPQAKIYSANLDDLVHELPQAKRLLERKSETGGKSLLDFLGIIDPYKAAFFKLYRLCRIAVTVSVTSAAAERSFSALNLIKTYLRNTMTDNRLSNLDVLHIERKRSNELDLDDFVDIFANHHENRKIALI